MNREAIWTKIFDVLTTIKDFQESGRKVIHWNDCPAFPAVYLNQGGETVRKPGRGIPSIYELQADIYIYCRNESNGVPAIQINELLDKVIVALLPPNPIDNKQTLGGIVEDAWVEGEISRDEGTLGDFGVAIVPFKVLVSF